MRAGRYRMVNSGRTEIDPMTPIDALFNNEFVHMSHLEQLLLSVRR